MQLQLKDQKWIDVLVSLPETGMGYQIVDVTVNDGSIIPRIAVLNSEILVLPALCSISENDIIKIELSL